jgi:preprotein translocase subunit SecG
MDASMIRIICVVLAISLLGLIVLRRKKNADE